MISPTGSLYTNDVDIVLARLRELGSPAGVAGLERFGIKATSLLGVSMEQLRALAKELGRDHALAEQLRDAGIHEARILSALIANPTDVDRAQAEAWIGSVENWADCDSVCLHLLRKVPFAHELAEAWRLRPEEYVRRAGFTLMAVLAVHDKDAPDATFRRYLPMIEKAADDGRNGVKKAVNWALRQIGKRNARLNRAAIQIAERIRLQPQRSARWIAGDALRELRKVPNARGWE